MVNLEEDDDEEEFNYAMHKGGNSGRHFSSWLWGEHGQHFSANKTSFLDRNTALVKQVDGDEDTDMVELEEEEDDKFVENYRPAVPSVLKAEKIEFVKKEEEPNSDDEYL